MSVVRPMPRRSERGSLPMTPGARVTAHAVRRYIERVARFPVAQAFGYEPVPDCDIAWIDHMRHVIDVEAIADGIFRLCRPAMGTGARSVYRDQFVYILSPVGNVTTIIPVDCYMTDVMGGPIVKKKKQRRHDDDLEDVRHYGGARFAYR